MMREPDRSSAKNAEMYLGFMSPNDPSPRVVNRTTSRIDGFPAKLEPRKDLYRANDRKPG
jgi:hypothetical protein